jgi:hypothetical protein
VVSVLFVLVPAAGANVVVLTNFTNCSGSGVTVTETTISFLPNRTVAGVGCFHPDTDQFTTAKEVSLDLVLNGLARGFSKTACISFTPDTSCSSSTGSPFLFAGLDAGTTAQSLEMNGTLVDRAWHRKLERCCRDSDGEFEGELPHKSVSEPSSALMGCVSWLDSGYSAENRWDKQSSLDVNEAALFGGGFFVSAN